MTDAAPMYITIGPPCAGKTTWLKQKQQQGESAECGASTISAIVDIALDNQQNVYIPLPTAMFLPGTAELSSASQRLHNLWNQSYFGRTVAQRMASGSQLELRMILQRLAGRISRQEMEKILRTFERQSTPQNAVKEQTSDTSNTNRTTLSQSTAANNTTCTPSMTDHNAHCSDEERISTLVEAVESLIQEGASDGQSRPLRTEVGNTSCFQLPKSVDLYVPEALHQKDGVLQNVTGVERATQELQRVPRDTPVAWGNTNTRPQDYLAALELAEKQQRPVYFVVYDSAHMHRETYGSAALHQTNNTELFDLPHIGYAQLLRRNLQRFLLTGRYIPSQVIWDTSERVGKLTGDVLQQLAQQRARVNSNRQAGPSSPMDTEERLPTKLELDCQLARLVQYWMHDDRTVTKIVRNPHYQDRQRYSPGRSSAKHPNRRYDINQQQQHKARGRGGGGKRSRAHHDSGRPTPDRRSMPRQQPQIFDGKASL